MASNPTRLSGEFHAAFTSKAEFWKTMTISALDVPAGIPGLATQAWCEEKRKEWGDDSALYAVRVLGEFPKQGSDAVIPLSLLFAMIHLADDYSRGFSAGGTNNLAVLPVLALWLYATLVLVERRSGHIVILLMSIVGSGIPVVHMFGRSGLTGGATAKSAGALFFALTLLVVGTVSLVSVLLSVSGLWNLRRGLASQSEKTVMEGSGATR